ncbi:hypothetical protein [uncultured Flavobacterium sp.]|uniref:hypothetical protein n=1 Tax=uncultured Flavobacterium sp. TaxID=165435 RepID=UPI0030EB5CF0|tara:strand:+ start:2588 stop:3301 length:714 start_codon:yes stop_codon:yes gene_type:complete
MKNIPQVNFIYWLLMIIATTTGEIVGNYISRDLELGYKVGSVILVSLFIISIIYEIKNKKKNLLFYWFLIIVGNIAGTNVADLICIQLELGTIYGSLLVILTLFLVLIGIHLLSKSKNPFTEMKVEFLYWLAILFSSTFGTTSGDFLSNDTPLGAAGGTILLVILLLIFVVLLFLKKISKEVFYWIAIILIHPIGATFGNYISKPQGLDLGNVYTSIFLVTLFSITYFTNKQSHEQI